MDEPLPWEAAEDAFLAMFCDSTRHPFGTRYGFRLGNRRFNAVRIVSAEALAAIDWPRFIEEQDAYFAGLGRALTLQLPEPLVPPPEAGEWIAVGPAYHHARTPLASFAAPLPEATRLRVCATRDDVRRFAELSLPTQIPPALREQIRRESEDRVDAARTSRRLLPFLYEERDEPIGTVGVLPFRDGHTVFALWVAPTRRGQGHMKAIYASLAARLEGDLYGQIEEGLATMGYRASLDGTERLARTRTYRRADDPRFTLP